MGKDEDIPTATAVADESTPLTASPAPAVNDWKTGLCGCCQFGPWHPAFLNACCFPQILMAQVLTRLKYNWLGDPTSDEAVWKSTFKIILGIVVAFAIFEAILGCPPPIVEVADDDLHEVVSYDESNCPTWQRTLTGIVSTVFGLYTLVVMIKARAAVRARRGIRSECCGGGLVEDCCCVFWCGCCTVSQMARETADYDVYASKCCAPTGLPGYQEDPIGLVL